jgi:methionyl-tRNA synthetase
MAKLYLTTTIPYVNASPHIGHALEFVQADVIARARRAAGDEVYFLSGADENAMKNVRAAEQAGVPVEAFVAKNSQAFKDLLAALGVTNDQFIRTTEERHKRGAQALWSATKPEDIYKKTYEGLYCTGCELFYRPEELNEQGECIEHPGRKPEVVQEENYFFRLSAYAERLEQLITSGELAIVPESRKNEVLAFIRRGLEDFSISRPVARSKGWGVPVPGDEGQTMYVWYDALANYITALGYPETTDLYQKFWTENPVRMHILGKGVSRFHAVYWPAMLLGAGLPLPTREFVHGYVTVNGQKVSKTLGNVVDPMGVIAKYGVDAVRYYLLREISPYEDGDWSDERFAERYTADLANGLGNLTARLAALGEKCGPMALKELGARATMPRPAQYDTLLSQYRFKEVLDAIWAELAGMDKYINDQKLWQQEAQILKHGVAACAMNLLYQATLLEPFLPNAVQRIREQFVVSGDTLTVTKGAPIFPRIS